VFKNIRYDIRAVMDRDPAARSAAEVFLLYPGIWAVIFHRLSHFLFKKRRFFLARLISQFSRWVTGIEIHPGATIGRGFFVDHGMGVVIGETAEIGDNVTIYQGVTLGGTGKDKGKRHPTIGNNVLIGTGAKVLGPFRVGDNSKIAANAVVLNEVPPNCTCVGVPARVIKQDNKRFSNLDHIHSPDPIAQELARLLGRIEKLESKLNIKNNSEGGNED